MWNPPPEGSAFLHFGVVWDRQSGDGWGVIGVSPAFRPAGVQASGAGRFHGVASVGCRMQWWTIQQLKARKPEARRQAVEKLAGDLSGAAIPALLQVLGDTDAEVRRAVVSVLGTSRDERVLAALPQALRDPVAEVREQVVTVLGLYKEARFTEVFVGLLKDPHPGVRRQAGRALDGLGWEPKNETQQIQKHIAAGDYVKAARLGAGAVDPLAAVLKDPTSPNRRAVVEALSLIGDARIVRPLLMALKDRAPEVKAAAIEALSPMREAGITEGFIGALRDADHHVRAAAADALGKRKETTAGEALQGLLKDGQWDVRRSAVDALARLGLEEAVPAISPLLKDKDNDVREAAARALGKIGAEAGIPKLILALCDPHTPVRQAASAALRSINPRWERLEVAQQAVTDLKAALNDREYWVRQSAAETLAKISNIRTPDRGLGSFINASQHRHQVVVDVLAESLLDYDPDLRFAAAQALGRVGEKASAPALQALAATEDLPWVLDAACSSLTALGVAVGVVPGEPRKETWGEWR